MFRSATECRFRPHLPEMPHLRAFSPHALIAWMSRALRFGRAPSLPRPTLPASNCVAISSRSIFRAWPSVSSGSVYTCMICQPNFCGVIACGSSRAIPGAMLQRKTFPSRSAKPNRVTYTAESFRSECAEVQRRIQVLEVPSKPLFSLCKTR